MAFPSDLVRTKNWGTETLTDADLEGQFDLIINWVMDAMDSSTGHDHSTTNKGPTIGTSGITADAVDGTLIADDAVDKEHLAVTAIRADNGLSQHTDGALQVDPSDTNPGLEIADGGVRVKVDDTTIERAAGGIQIPAAWIDALVTIKDYGTSETTGTTKNTDDLKICYGRADVNTSQAITNLPFSNSTSYVVVTTAQGTDTYQQSPVVTRNSGSQFTIYEESTGAIDVFWIAVGT